MGSKSKLLCSVALAGALAACTVTKPPGAKNKGDGGVTGGSGGAGGDNGGGGGGGGTGGSGGTTDPPDLGSWPDGCPAGTPTRVTGKVFAPNGTLPLFNASVYVPSGTPPTPKDGVTCDRCGDISSRALVVTQTDATGAFSLDGVPSGSSFPLVIELGKWRRQLMAPAVGRCMTGQVPNDQTRFPKNPSEGSMPQMAIATGAADPFECLLLKIGIDPAEITLPTGKGKVHFYRGATKPGTTMTGAPSEDDASAGLYTSLNQLLKYDVLMLPCEGANDYTKTTDPQRQLLVQYLAVGGRLFSTHYSYNWLTYTNSPFNVIGKWTPDSGRGDSSNSTIDTSFPKGASFAQWLHNVDPTVNGSFDVVDPRYDLQSIDTKYAQRWMYDTGNNNVMHTTFNTPLDPMKDKDGKPQYCGRVVFSDFHVSTDALKLPAMKNPDQVFPDACKGGDLTTQEKALAFMLFDLSACVLPDTIPPIP